MTERKVALVTGAGSGIGKQLALRLGDPRRGFAVALVARTVTDLEAVAAEIEAQGGSALAVPADVGDWEAAHRAISRTVDAFGRIDVLVNAAGVSHPGSFISLTRDEAEAMVRTNLLGVVACTHAALPHLAAQRGVVVNISSMAGLVGVPGLAVYSATKWAVTGLSEALRAELSRSGIRVVVVHPTYVSHTRMLDYELQRGPLIGYSPAMVLTAEQVADRILKAIDGGKSQVVIAPLIARLGLGISSLFPGLRGRVMARLYAASASRCP
jgi:short-subunit dehydrogenase